MLQMMEFKFQPMKNIHKMAFSQFWLSNKESQMSTFVSEVHPLNSFILIDFIDDEISISFNVLCL